jgi:predicted DNA-binding transcriptional regulator AlpA
MSNLTPARHNLDRRAEQLASTGAGAADDLLSTRELADWLDVSIQWVEIGRHAGYGPRFRRIGPRRIRYLRADVMEWLDDRAHASTAEYAKAEA